MTADPLAGREVQWPRPPAQGYVAEDLDRIADLPLHTQLIDGSLVFVSSQREFHMLVVTLLENGLRRSCPAPLRVRREMTVTLSPSQRPEPDLLIVRAGQTGGPRTSYSADGVELVVEVVSPDSVVRDRERKPELYAAARIAHFWRVEESAGRPTVYVYELDPATGHYALTGIHHDQLRVTVPWEIDIDLRSIDGL